MINTVVQALLKFVLWLIQTLLNIIVYPIAQIIIRIFPSLPSISDTVLDFMNDYIFTGIKFCKNVFLNVTHMSPTIFCLGISFIEALALFYFAIVIYRVIMGIWYLYRGH